jgi:transposase-like protein
MGRSSREERQSTRPTWETLEAWVRVKVQEFVQAVLEEEVTEALGRRRYERRDGVDAPVGHRNGYGKPRRLALQTGTIVVRRPRVRGLEERFESRLLPPLRPAERAGGRPVARAVSPRARAGRLRAGVARLARRRRAIEREVERAAAGEVRGRVRALEGRGRWTIASSCTPGPTASTCGPGSSRRRRRCW